MLVTTCPECGTTFRVTEAILAKASGQVRCGRCAHIFDARNALREHEDTGTRPVAALQDTADETRSAAVSAEASGSTRSWILQDEAVGVARTASSPAAASRSDDEGLADAEGLTYSETAADTEAPPAPETPAASDIDGDATGSWLPSLDEIAPRRTWPWVAGTVVLGLALAVQLVHHFRGELADAPLVGAAVRGAYAALGAPVTGRVDLDQYATVDLTAVAEPGSDEQGWLVIETRIQNRGPKEQPYPYIFVSLLDRWEETIAGRYFAPEEYVVRAASDYSRMRIGSTVDAQFIIADPGPSATGFELEFCTPAAESFLCENDAVLE